MRKIGLMVGLVLMFAASAVAQVAPLSRVFNINSIAAGATVNVSALGLNYYRLQWAFQGPTVPSACTVLLQTSNDGVTWATGITGDCSTNSESTVTIISTNYVRANVTAFTAASSGNEVITIIGWANNPDPTVSVTASVTGNAAAGLTGAVAPTSAGYTGILDGVNLVGVTGTSVGGKESMNVDVLALPALPTGSNVIGHVIADTGSHAIIDSGTVTTVTTVTAVTAITNALPAGTNVIGHVINDASTAVIGHVIVDSGAATGVAQGSTTSGQLGQLMQGAVTTAAPTYTTAQTSPLSLTTGGALRSEIENLPADAANQATVATNPVPIAGVYYSGGNTLTNGQVGYMALDSLSHPVVVTFPGTLRSGAVTTAMTGTTTTPVISAVASNYLYISSCTTSNGSLTVSTDINLQDGSGGTVLAVLPAPAAAVATTGGGGGTYPFPTPLKVPTLGNGLYAVNVTTNASTKISCLGFSSTASY